MPGTTPVYGITYPVDTDPLADGAAAIQDTAETVEAALQAAVAATLTEAEANAAYAPKAAHSAKGWRNAALSIANVTSTVIPLDSESFDTGTLHDNATNPSRITVARSGYYLITGQVRWSASTAGAYRSARILQGGAVIADSSITPAGASQPGLPTNTVTALAQAGAGSFFELEAYQDSGGSLALTAGAANTFLSVIYVGE